MLWWQAAILGVVQGITEFLPISSDGHLALTHALLNVHESPLTFDVVLHGGTLVTMIIFFWKSLWALKLKDWVAIGIANIPVVIAGITIRSSLEGLSSSPLVVAGSFLVTALFLFLADMIWNSPKTLVPELSIFNTWVERLEKWHNSIREPNRPQFSLSQAFGVGLFQTLALLPGLSRSGSSLFGGAVVGLPREYAFTFAFLLGIPAIAGAVGYDLLKVAQEGNLQQHPWGMYLFGAVCAGLSGWVALKFLARVVRTSRLRWFGFYCVFVSILSFFIV